MHRGRLLFSALALSVLLGVASAQLSPSVSISEAGAAVAARKPLCVDSGFRPSVDGYAFKNSFSKPDDNWIEKLGGGRCGGMAYASLDRFHEGSEPGTKESDAARIARRNLDSLVGNGARFVLWTAWSSVSAGLAPDVTAITRREELPRLARDLEKGPVPLGLVRTQRLSAMKLNHQVVAYAMDSDGDVARISIYDPNHPSADDVVIEVPLGDAEAPIVSKRGTAPYALWEGLFVERYAAAATRR